MFVFGGIYDPIRMFCYPLRRRNLNDLWRMDLQNIQALSWECIEAKGKPPSPRHGHTMNHLNGLLIIFGGQDDNNRFLNDLIVFQIEQREW